MSEETKAQTPSQLRRGSAAEADLLGDAEIRRETLELVRAYYRISDPAIRRRVFELAKALGVAVE